MNDNTVFIGIDISKATFDVSIAGKLHFKFENNINGFNALFDQLEAHHWCVMEATGSYHIHLANYLHNHGVRLSVVNPLVIKRFIQMKLKLTKTDKADAQMIAQYGAEQRPNLWEPPSDYVFHCQQIESVLALYIKQSTALKNKMHNLESAGSYARICLKTLRLQLKAIKREIVKLEEALECLIKENEPELFCNLKTIPGIGRKTVARLIVSTDGFRNFKNARQVISYYGLAPVERSSGSSIRGKTTISKRGHTTMRNHLFLCSFTACVHNLQCRALYKRITDKGKSKNLL